METGSFWISTVAEDGGVLARLTGELDMVGAEDVRAFAESLSDQPYRFVRLDCREVTFIDSVGVKSLLHVVRRCAELGIDATFSLSARIQRVLDAMGVGSMDDLAARMNAQPA